MNRSQEGNFLLLFCLFISLILLTKNSSLVFSNFSQFLSYDIINSFHEMFSFILIAFSISQ